jgi:dolichyl-diphosphooligosaccharide--protein glycosyltransferase
MNDGYIDIPLRSILYVNNGFVVDQQDYVSGHGYYLQILMKDNKINSVLMANEDLFRSDFNQQYLLGNYDGRYFEEVYNGFPEARILKIKTVSVDSNEQ